MRDPVEGLTIEDEIALIESVTEEVEDMDEWAAQHFLCIALDF